MDLTEATAQARSAAESIHAELQSGGLDPGPIEVGEPSECTDEMNRLNGTAEREVRFDAVVGTDSDVEALSAAVERAAKNMKIRRSSDPETGRPLIVGTDGGRQIALSFSIADGGRTATVVASTGCRPTG